uniref:Bet v I/Major latex protein domain-containing protein n=1 Tax=Cucumis sativus TaxID=3659 RepID=A0A0A0LA17_CUCSA
MSSLICVRPNNSVFGLDDDLTIDMGLETYTYTGRAVEVKMKLLVDEANKTIIYECLEGDLFKDFDMFKVKIEVTDGGSSGNSSVNWCLEFVKSNENVAPPNDYLQFGVKICKDVDAYLSNN